MTAPATTVADIPPPSPAVEVLVDVRIGPRSGSGRAVLVGDDVWTCLPGLDVPRRTAAELFPSWLAALVGLGPRPHLKRIGVLVTERSTLDEFLTLPNTTGDGVRAHFAPAQLSPRWVEQLTAIPGGVRAHWSVTTASVASTGSAGVRALARIEVVDTGAAGLWSIGQVDASLLASPMAGDAGTPPSMAMTTLATTTATAVWTVLAELAALRP
ncbi:MAG: hypothetical protein ABR608_14380 [Pseudonocardiaceae bacterium]